MMLTTRPVSASTWRTEGPIDFAHVYLRPSWIDDVVTAEFDRDSRQVSLLDAMGASDALLQALLVGLADAADADEGAGRLYWEDNIELNDTLLAEAMRLSGAKTKRAVVEEALRTFVEVRSHADKCRAWGEKVDELRLELVHVQLTESSLDILRRDRERE